MNKIIIKNIAVKQNRVVYNYDITGDWIKYFNLNEKFFVEYDNNIEDVPNSILAIPFLANVLPIAWLCNAEITIDEVDKKFLDNIDLIKSGYEEMYPMLKLNCKFNCSKVIDNSSKKCNSSLAFFSGGVDAYNTLINHIDEKPTIVTVHGADIKVNDEAGWDNVYKNITNVSKEFNLNMSIIKSNFRIFINELCLNSLICHSGDNWWHGFQHGIGIISLSAPLTWIFDVKKVYFASTFTFADKGKVTCASDPSIDNNLHIGNCEVIHDGYEYTRQDKVHNIVQFSKSSEKKIDLRVCWQDNAGVNCCKCEKCMRTIIEIFAENEDPRNFGINYTIKDLKYSKNIYKTYGKMPYYLRGFYKEAQDKINSHSNSGFLPVQLEWFKKIDVNKIDKHPIYYFIYRCKNKLNKIMKGK